MTYRHSLPILVALASSTALGCGDIDPAPSADFFGDGGARDPEFGLTEGLGGTAPPAVPRPGGGDQRPGDGTVDGDQRSLCVAVELRDPFNFVDVSFDGTTFPFTPRAALGRITTNDRGEPILLVALTEGACELGVGNELLFEIDRAAVGRDVVVGDNVIGPEPSPLRVRFNNLSDPGVPEIFGTCSDASGAIGFGQIGSEEGALVRATFPEIRLGSCIEPFDGTATFGGGFNVPLAADPRL